MRKVSFSIRHNVSKYLSVIIIVCCIASAIPANAQVPIVFQQGLGGYDGVHDTFYMTGNPIAINGDSTEWEWDGEDAGGLNFGMIRFDNIFGANPGQVPPDANIINAVLTLTVTNEGDASQTATMHELLTAFDDTKDFFEFGDKSGADPLPGQDYVEEPIASIPGPTVGTILNLDVTASIKRIQAGGDNFGWVFIPGGSNGVGIASSEAASGRPTLTITIEGTEPPTATRSISPLMFAANETLNVSITVSLAQGTQNVTLVETLPAGWSATSISGGGTFADGAITWTLNMFSGTQELTYVAQAPASPAGDALFNGSINESFFVLGQNTAYLIPSAPIGEFESHHDIGAVGAAGEASFENGEYEVRGSGADIWGSADEFHYVYKRVTGAFRFSASLNGFNDDGTNEWSKVGIMVRDNNSAGSAYFYSMVRGSDFQYDTQWRSSQNASAANIGLVPTVNGEVAIVRVGNTLQAFYKVADGDDFVLHTTQQIELSDPVLVGLAVTSHDDGLFAVGMFTNVEIDLFPFEPSRSFAEGKFLSGKLLRDVTVTAKVREGQSPNLTITETPPAGWVVSNIRTTAGTATVQNGNIVWTITGATGEPKLTYDVTTLPNDIVGMWSGSGTDGNITLDIGGPSSLDAVPPLFKTRNVLAIGLWNDNNTSSDLAACAELSDNNGVKYVQDSSATGGWPSGTVFRWKVVFFDDGFGEEEPGWQHRDYTNDTEANFWTEQTDVGFTIGHGGNDAENGETILDTSMETVYTRSIFDAQNYESITELTLQMAADDEAVAWLNGVFIGFTANGTSDRGETARDFVFDTTISGGAGGLESGTNPTVYTGSGTRTFTFPVNLVESDVVSVFDWTVY